MTNRAHEQVHSCPVEMLQCLTGAKVTSSKPRLLWLQGPEDQPPVSVQVRRQHILSEQVALEEGDKTV
jgi:hypothetical protein